MKNCQIYSILKKTSKIIIFLFTDMSGIHFLVYNGSVVPIERYTYI